MIDYHALHAELLKPEYAGLSDADAAARINAQMTTPARQYVFGSFRTMAAVLTPAEYNTLRATLKAAAAQEQAAGGSLLADMQAMLSTPGEEGGSGGGLDLASDGVTTMLAQFAAAVPALADVPAKLAAFVAKFQPQPQHVWPTITADHVRLAKEVQL